MVNNYVITEKGDSFIIRGKIYESKRLSLHKKIFALKIISGYKLSDFANVLNISPQQFNYKIHHKLNVSEIYLISKFLNLNNDQIVNIFLISI